MTDLDTTPGPQLHLAAPGPVTASESARTISGRVVPFGPAGQTTAGTLTFGAGSLRWASDVKRVKLLREHDQRDAVGYATALEERPDGLWATFTVPETDAGDRALAEAREGLRDAFSVGTQLDGAVAQKLRKAAVNGGSVAATGTLREVSLVSVPAFDDARVDSVAAAAGHLTVSAWTDPQPEQQSDPDPQPESTEETTVTDAPTVTTDAAPEEAAGPVRVQAAAGAAVVTGAPATYRFNGDGPSLVADAGRAAQGDAEAQARLARFNAELVGQNPASQLALAAVLVRDPVPTMFLPDQAQLPPISTAVNAGRPLASRLQRVQINNAQPFGVPIFGEFAGVGLHTEGTPHVAEGVLTLGDATVQPRAVSGAYRISRELADSSSPAIDQLALTEMIAEYQAATEARIAAALAAGAGVTTGGITSVMDLRGELIAALGASDRPADFVAAGTAFYAGLAADVDTTGRPFFSYAPAVNSPAGGSVAGYTGATVDGTEVALSSRVAAGEAYVLRRDAVLFAESAAQTFRLEQPEGPGIIKLAIFGYVAAQVMKPTGVRRVTSAA